MIRKLDGQIIEFPELDLIVWGRAMEEHEPAFSPLAHIPDRDDRRWHLAMGHGFFYEERQRPDRSSPIFADEIRDSGWDYIALGHQHVQTNVSQGSVTAYYSGAPSTEWSGAGPDGSVLHVDLSEQQRRPRYTPADSVAPLGQSGPDGYEDQALLGTNTNARPGQASGVSKKSST